MEMTLLKKSKHGLQTFSTKINLAFNFNFCGSVLLEVLGYYYQYSSVVGFEIGCAHPAI